MLLGWYILEEEKNTKNFYAFIIWNVVVVNNNAETTKYHQLEQAGAGARAGLGAGKKQNFVEEPEQLKQVQHPDHNIRNYCHAKHI